MKYFYDTEFIENGETIDLISVGIVCDDGREYYAISNDFNPKNASEWVKENVLKKLPKNNINLSDHSISPRVKQESLLWKSRKQIKNDIKEFIQGDNIELWAYYSSYDHVALCQLFGKMIDLPKHFPMFTMDIKQLCMSKGNPRLPDQKDKHNALSDAKWNRECYESLNSML